MKSFTRDLVGWIEDNLDKKLSLDDVAARAGYSKWHLQRFFSNETGITLAAYIRFRKLNRAAVMLKMTRLPIIDISEVLGFSTQQVFNRTFKCHFGAAPGRYRASQLWHFKGMLPELAIKRPQLPVPQRITTTLNTLPGISLSYTSSCAKLGDVAYHAAMRNTLFRKAENMLGDQHPVLSVSEIYEPACNHSDQIKFNLTFNTGFSDHDVSRKEDTEFLRFPFKGTPEQLTEMQINIYQHLMPTRHEARRAGHDYFVCERQENMQTDKSKLAGFYYVPVSGDVNDLR